MPIVIEAVDLKAFTKYISLKNEMIGCDLDFIKKYFNISNN
jgi:hypothetical protein